MVIECKNISCNYLRNINLTIKNKDLHFIIGKQSSGKTTLLKLIKGLIKPLEGQIFFDGRKGTKKDFNQIGFLVQNPENQLFANSVIEDIMFGPLNCKMTRSQSQIMAENAMKAVNLPMSLKNMNPFMLSTGQQHLVAFAGILAMNTEVLLLDQVSENLDCKQKKEIFRILKELNRQGKTIVVASDSLNDAFSYAKTVSIINKKDSFSGVVFSGSVKSVLQNQKILKKGGFELPIDYQALFLNFLQQETKEQSKQ